MTLPNGLSWRDAFEWLWRVLTVLIIPIGIWLVALLGSINSKLESIGDRVTVLEQTTLRSADGLSLYQELAYRPTRDELQAKLDRLEAIVVRVDVKLDELAK